MKLDISGKVTLTVGASFVALVAALIAISASSSIDFARHRAVEQQEANMRVAWEVLNPGHADYRLVAGHLVVGDRPVDRDFATVDKIKALVGGVATVFASDTRVQTNVQKPGGGRAVGTKLAPGPVYDAVLKSGRSYRGEAQVLGRPYFVGYDPIKSVTGEVIGILFVGVPQADYFQPVYQQIEWLVGAGVLLGALGVTASVVVVRRQLRPLRDVREAMSRVTGGDLDVALDFAGRPDDIGRMADAVHTFRDNLQEKARIEQAAEQDRRKSQNDRRQSDIERRQIEEEQALVVTTLAENLGRLAQGDLGTRITTPFSGRYAQVRSDFNEAVTRLEAAMAAISAASGGLSNGSDELAAATIDLSRRTEQQAASLEETAAALDQISTTVRQSADGARTASAAARDAKADTERSLGVMGEAVSAMAEIEASSGRITQIFGVIDEIAFQTNLLALNAGVEAARAGDAGRGFAVVAQEVRALAQRSAEAAREIKGLIAASSSGVDRGVKLVGVTSAALEGIVDKVTEINGQISAIALSAQEQATGLGEINSAVNQMDQVTQQNAAMVEEASAIASTLKSEAVELTDRISQFQISDDAWRNVAAA